LHTDAVQCAGKIPLDFRKSGPDFLSISGHKFGAPKGIGALLIKQPAAFLPWHYGGKQEHGHRAGTENVGHIVALGAAAEACRPRNSDTWVAIEEMRDSFETQLRVRFRRAVIHGSKSPRLPNTSNIHLSGMDGDALVTFLDSQGICVSSGSACLESAISPSHVIYAMTGSHEQASETVRISLGLASTEAELSRLMGRLKAFAAFDG
jgi:cysteine desulfurase